MTWVTMCNFVIHFNVKFKFSSVEYVGGLSMNKIM
jgi:hypothetical protein